MTEHDSLSPFLQALRSRQERRCVAAPMAPDVVDVIDRAALLDEQAIPSGLRSSLIASRPASAELPEEAETPDRPDAALMPFVAALRARTQEHARARELRPVSAEPSVSSARWRWTRGAGLALVAAVLLVFALPRLSSTLLENVTGGGLMEAERSTVLEHDTASVRTGPGNGAKTMSRRPAPQPTVESQTLSVESLVTEPELAPEPAVVVPNGERTQSRRRPRVRVPEDGALEAEAHRRWQAGDLAGAEQLLRRVIAGAGRSSRAELAYGDLFSLARQRGGQGAQAKVWREYVRKFPGGRFADDARAGLCRRASDDVRAACWAEYLSHHPNGTHAIEARRSQSE